MAFHSGFVAIVGRPNVGKSTLLNRLTGEKVAITSPKPQTTRNTIRTVLTDEQSQLVFLDTPGIHKPKTKLGEFMMTSAERTLNEVDAVLYLIEADELTVGAGETHIIEMLSRAKSPVILVINKVDSVNKEKILLVIEAFKDKMNFRTIIPVSALTGDGTDILLAELRKMMPEGPKYFPEDMLTDQPEKQIVAEIIREKMLQLLDDEVPHGVGVEVTSFKERPGKEMLSIQATIYCERDSHKGIVIGKKGAMLKKIGTLSREDAEKFLGTKIFLELWVKVKPDWRNNSGVLKDLGYRMD